MTSSESVVIICEGIKAGKTATLLKNSIRSESFINVDESDVALLRLGTHPKQEEITSANALRNLVHVGTEEEGCLEQIAYLINKFS